MEGSQVAPSNMINLLTYAYEVSCRIRTDESPYSFSWDSPRSIGSPALSIQRLKRYQNEYTLLLWGKNCNGWKTPKKRLHFVKSRPHAFPLRELLRLILRVHVLFSVIRVSILYCSSVVYAMYQEGKQKSQTVYFGQPLFCFTPFMHEKTEQPLVNVRI